VAPVKIESLIPCVVSFGDLHSGKDNRLHLDPVELDWWCEFLQCCSDRPWAV
jgi:hypothetical protein